MALNSTEVQGGAKLLKFVPPKEEAKNLPRWASYVVGGGMKTHSGVAWAKLSFNNRGWTRVVNPDYNEETDKYWQKYKVSSSASVWIVDRLPSLAASALVT